MTATALIVELVLTGVITLAVLLLPAFAAGWDPAWYGIAGETAVAAGLGVGFLIGVVVDRSADTLLDRWLGMARLRFAYNSDIEKQRRAMCGSGVTDCFPEDWMRTRLLTRGSEHLVKAYEQWRVRIRIARTVVILTPAVTTSALAALWISNAIRWGAKTVEMAQVAAALVPCGQILALLGLAIAAKALKPPHTAKLLKKPEPTDWWRWLGLSAATGWMTVQLATAVALLRMLGQEFAWTATSITVGGAAVTVLAADAWFRINKTFMQFLWDYCRFEAAEGLTGACRAPQAGDIAPMA